MQWVELRLLTGSEVSLPTMGQKWALSPSETLLNLKQIIFFPQLYRHGDRSPVKTYPKDPYQEDEWPQGFGQLTKVGQKSVLPQHEL